MKRIAIGFAVLVLASCSAEAGSGGGGPEVASISTPVSTSAPTASEEQRPRERLDMTPEDQEALAQPYQRCLAEHGVDKRSVTEPGGSGPPPKASVDRGNKACESKRPLPPWEQDPANPESGDFANRVVQCLRAKGVRYVEVDRQFSDEFVSVALGGPGNDQQSITLGLQHMRECELQSAKK